MDVLRVYPEKAETRPLEGLYLDDLPKPLNEPFVYANFLVSLDGRIAVRDQSAKEGVPKAIANDRDWRLYTELLMQADAVLTTSHHARSIAAGKQADMMTQAQARYPDLRNYRRARGLSGHPTCVVVSSSFNFPAAALKAVHPGPIVAVSPATETCRVQSASNAGVETVSVGSTTEVTGQDLMTILRERGLKRIYMVGGPRLFHSLLKDGAIHRLYLTTAGRLLGGEDIETAVRGRPFPVPPEGRLRHLTLDPEASPQQMFACYDVQPY